MMTTPEEWDRLANGLPRRYSGDVERRYYEDPEFKAMVDTMRVLLGDGRFTPLEMRQAAVMACTMYERESWARPRFVPKP